MGFQLPRKSESTGEFITPDAGVYTLEFMGYDDPVPSSFDEDKLRMKLKFEVVDDEEYEGVTVNQWYGVSMHVRSKLYPVIKALRGGQEIDEDEDINLDELIGARIQGTLDKIEKPDKNDPTRTIEFPVLVAASPIRKKKSPTGTGTSLDAAKADRAAKIKAQKEEDVWDEEGVA